MTDKYDQAIAEMCGHCCYEHGTHACRNAKCSRRIYVDALRSQQERDNPKPLTLEELRQRDKKPVWHVNLLNHDCDCWRIFWMIDYKDELDDYGKTWLAYDQEPKEGV